MKNNILLALGALLVCFSLFGQYFDTDFLKPGLPDTTSYVIDAPADTGLLEKAKIVTETIQNSEDTTTRSDCLRLSALYADMAILLELDKDDLVIKDTASIREANSLSGKMLRLNIKDKYPGLAEDAKDLLSEALGDEDVTLDDDLRAKAVDAFRALSWAFYEGSR
jgi:hypothetical protein